MAKTKKTTTRKKVTKKVAKTASKKKPATKTNVAHKKPSSVKKTVVKKVVKKQVVKKQPAAKQKPVRTTAKPVVPAAAPKKRRLKLPKSLGRPSLPGDARLDLVFQKDYQAREIFAFLGVQTIRELEQFSPKQIIDRLTGPMVQTVQRVRKALALNSRCLADDRSFALDFQKQWKTGRK